MTMQQASSSRSGELGLMDMVRVLLDQKILIIVVAAVCTAVAVLLALTATQIYRSETQVVPAADNSASNPLSSLVSGLPNIGGLNALSNKGGSGLAEAIATIKSQQFTVEFIEEQNLLPVLFADQWDASAKKWDVDEPEQIPSLADGYILFSSEVRKIVEEDDTIVTLAIEWSDPQLSADWANALVAKLNLRMREKAISEADRTIAFLQEELLKTNVVEIRQAIFSMMENQLNTRTVASVREEYSFRVISPAIAPEPDRFIRPQRLFMVIMGGIFGMAFGVFLSFLLFGIRRIRSELS